MGKRATDEKFNRRLTDKLDHFTTPPQEFDHGDEETEHPDEKWLISYADMMTLLFGLFVMLYAIAMDTQGQPDRVLSDIAQGKNSLAEIQSEVKDKVKQLETVKNELKVVTAELAQTNVKLKETVVEKDKLKSLSDQLQAQLEQQTLAQSPASPSDETQKLLSESVSLKQSLAEREKLLSVKQNELLGKTKEIATLRQTAASLQKQVFALNEDAKSTNFMIIILRWNTEKHDLDLRVTIPSGRTFDFQERTFEDSKAKFVVDSRIGPGVEMWETPEILPGDYKIEFKFYNNYGNLKPAAVSGIIITRKGEFEIPPFQMDFAKQKSKSFRLQTELSGKINIIPEELKR